MLGILLRAAGNIQRGTIHASYSQRGFIQEKKTFLIKDNYIRVESDKCHSRGNIKCNEGSERGKMRISKEKTHKLLKQPIFSGWLELMHQCSNWWIFLFLEKITQGQEIESQALPPASTGTWAKPSAASLKNNTGTDLQEVISVPEHKGR